MQDFQRVQQESSKKQQQELTEKIANQYVNRVSHLLDKVDKSEDRCGIFTAKGMQDYHPLLLMAGELDLEDTADIMREVAKRPAVLERLTTAAERGRKTSVLAEFEEISKKIKEAKTDNSSYAKNKEPLTQLKPSTVGSSSRKDYSLNDYKSDPRLR